MILAQERNVQSPVSEVGAGGIKLANPASDIEFLTDKDNYYLSLDKPGGCGVRSKRVFYDDCPKIDLSDIALYRIEEVSFEDQAPRREALENVLSAMRIDGINFIYLILGTKDGVEFYYGVSRNYNSAFDPELNIREIGERILEPSIRGNFRGSKAREVEAKDKRDIIERIDGMSQFSLLEGVPGVTKEDEQFQGVDRLADAMMGDTFGFMIVATPISHADVKAIEKDLYEIYKAIAPFVKRSEQSGSSTNESFSNSASSGFNTSTTKSFSKSLTNSTTLTDSTSQGRQSSTTISDGTSDSTTDGTNSGTTQGMSKSTTMGSTQSVTDSTNRNTTTGSNKSVAVGVSNSTTDGTTTSSTKGDSKSVTVGTNDSTTAGTSSSLTKGKSKSTTQGSSNGGSSSSTSKSGSEGTSTSDTTGQSQSGTHGTSKSSTEGTSTSTSKGDSHSSTQGTNKSSTEGTSTSASKGESHSSTQGTSKSGTEGTSTSKTSGVSSSRTSGTSHSRSTSDSTNTGSSHSDARSNGTSTTDGTSEAEGMNTGLSFQRGEGSSTSSATTREYVDKRSQDWIKYLDDVIFPRLDYGMGKGIYITTSFLFSNSKATIKKLENTAISLYSGESGNKVPLRAVSLSGGDPKIPYVKNLQIPAGHLNAELMGEQETIDRSALSQYIREDRSFVLGNWITTNELALISGLPQKEVVGLALKEEVEFGLNDKSQEIEDDKRLLLGSLIQSGNVLQTKKVYLNKDDLDKHIFVSGVTGSGKTTTCHSILCNSDLPFFVIEPAKTEYRVLKDKYPDLLVFTLGNETYGTPFRLNPFEFFPHESITSRVDMIRASIEAAFDMEAAIPQIIERSIYACYEDCGWDIGTNRNSKFADPFADGVYAFPTLKDLLAKVSEVVTEQGFDIRLQNDYIGSIKARLMGMTMGVKGMMLDTPRSIDFVDLVERRVVFELEEIRNGDEKSLIMGFILTNLMQAIKEKYRAALPHKHITLVEEAHRLLSRFTPGDSSNKKRGVETFADMLAEIRKYGECLIIVDQIPNKMTPEVLKNTNTKIVHKIFAEDDKDAIGNTMVLDKEQKAFLSNLDTGRAIVFSQGYSKAIQVQIQRFAGIDDSKRIQDEELRPAVYEYYAKNYKKGLIANSQFLVTVPDVTTVRNLLELSYDDTLRRCISWYCRKYQKFPTDTTLVHLQDICADPLTESLLREISNRRLGGQIRKECCVQYILKYKDRFEPEFFTQIVVEAFYTSKFAKRDKDLNKRILGCTEKLNVFFERYISDPDLPESALREIENLL